MLLKKANMTQKDHSPNYPISMGFQYGSVGGILLAIVYGIINQQHIAIAANTWAIVIPLSLLLLMLVMGIMLRSRYTVITFGDMLKGTFTTSIVAVTVYVLLIMLGNALLPNFLDTYRTWYIDNNITALQMSGMAQTDIDQAVIDIKNNFQLTTIDLLKLMLRMYFLGFVLAALLSLVLYKVKLGQLKEATVGDTQ